VSLYVTTPLKVANKRSIKRTCISSGMPVQDAMLFLRHSAIPRLNYLLRVLRPHIMQKAAFEFDRLVESIALFKLDLEPLDIPSRDRVLKQFRLPVKFGGFGLTNQASISPIAWWSAMASACSVLLRVLDSANISPAANADLNRTMTASFVGIQSHFAVPANPVPVYPALVIPNDLPVHSLPVPVPVPVPSVSRPISRHSA
jgi:hypothetical protein